MSTLSEQSTYGNDTVDHDRLSYGSSHGFFGWALIAWCSLLAAAGLMFFLDSGSSVATETEPIAWLLGGFALLAGLAMAGWSEMRTIDVRKRQIRHSWTFFGLGPQKVQALDHFQAIQIIRDRKPGTYSWRDRYELVLIAEEDETPGELVLLHNLTSDDAYERGQQLSQATGMPLSCQLAEESRAWRNSA